MIHSEVEDSVSKTEPRSSNKASTLSKAQLSKARLVVVTRDSIGAAT